MDAPELEKRKRRDEILSVIGFQLRRMYNMEQKRGVPDRIAQLIDRLGGGSEEDLPAERRSNRPG
jgi:hypothetical protein